MTNFLEVDWSLIPAPIDDGAAGHLVGQELPSIVLSRTDGGVVNLAELQGRSVIYAYPMTGRPDTPLPDGWDMMPGARGCTPQSCSFRDHAVELRDLGASHIFGVSTQTTEYQKEAAERLHLPFPLLSDHKLELAKALKLPTFEVSEMTLLRRLTMITDNAAITHVFYPVFPPDQNATDVIDWLSKSRQ